jgi:hypothetical protein
MKNWIRFVFELIYKDDTLFIMKRNSIIFLILILLVNQGFSQKKRVTISDFQDHKLEYALKDLREDSICCIPENATIMHCLPVDDISIIEVVHKKDRRFLGTVIGAGIGILPGLSMGKSEGNLAGDLLNAIFAVPVAIGGAMLGGFLGYQLGRESVTTIPIYGNKKLYIKQKEKLAKYVN